MKSLNEIAYSIRDQISGYFPSDDERIPIELIYKKVADVRMIMLKELQAENGYIDSAYYQRICCLEVQCGPIQCKGFVSTKKETFVELPQVAYDISGAIAFFGTADFSTDFKYVPVYGYPFSNHAPYTGSFPTYMRVDNIAIIKNLDTAVKFLCMIALLEDPLGSCLHLKADEEYPIPLGKVHQLELIVIKQLLSTLQIPHDITQNAVDDKLLGGNGQQKAQ